METSQNKIKVANDSPCSSCKIPNAMNFQNKINFEIEPFENLGRCRTSHGNAHKDFTEFNDNFEKSYLLNGLSIFVQILNVHC